MYKIILSFYLLASLASKPASGSVAPSGGSPVIGGGTSLGGYGSGGSAVGGGVSVGGSGGKAPIGGGASVGSSGPGGNVPIGSGVSVGGTGGRVPIGGGVSVGSGGSFPGGVGLPGSSNGEGPVVIPTSPGTQPTFPRPGFCTKQNEVWSYCNGGCDRSCRNYNPTCAALCSPGCVCRDGFLRDNSGNCVPYWSCYSSPCNPACQWYELCTQPPTPGGPFKCIQWYGRSGKK